jgi:hypothetical protein
MALKTITLSSEQIQEVENAISDLQLNGLDQGGFGDLSQDNQNQIIAQSIENQKLLIKEGIEFDDRQNIDLFFEKLKKIKPKKYANSAFRASHAGSF